MKVSLYNRKKVVTNGQTGEQEQITYPVLLPSPVKTPPTNGKGTDTAGEPCALVAEGDLWDILRDHYTPTDIARFLTSGANHVISAAARPGETRLSPTEMVIRVSFWITRQDATTRKEWLAMSQKERKAHARAMYEDPSVAADVDNVYNSIVLPEA